MKDSKKSMEQISEKRQDIKYDTRDYVVEHIVKKFIEEEFYVPLDYQRQFIWSEKDKCFFIESILMDLPIPFMFFADTEDGRIEIVDGAQRTQTLVQFVQNDLRLNNLNVLTESNGLSFNDLDASVQRRVNNKNIRVVFLEEGTTEKIRQEIFKRINTGGKPALPSEVRRGSLDGKFFDFLKECTKNETFNKLAPRTQKTESRFEGLELVARFFVYLDNYDNGFTGYSGEVAKYIDAYIEKQNEICNTSEGAVIIEKCRSEYEGMLSYAEKLLGERGFRKDTSSQSTPRARFEALSVGIALALRENPKLEIKNSNWIDHKDFVGLTKSDAANNKSKLLARINYVKNTLI